MDIELSPIEASWILTVVRLVTCVVMGSAIAVWKWRRDPDTRRGHLLGSMLRWTVGVFAISILVDLPSSLVYSLLTLLR